MKPKPLFSVCFTLLLFFSVATAQAATPSSIGVTLAPPNPAPFESVTIILNSFANNLDSVTISWFVNEKAVLSAVGQKTFSLTAPAAGIEAMVRAKIDLPEGALNIRVLIKPNPMTLLWQAVDSYVPPFYKGKALPGLDSAIKVVAMPEIKDANPKTLVYDWKRDYTNDRAASGYGKSSYTYTNDYLENSSVISVVASTTNGNASSEAHVTVSPASPRISFYREDNDLGVIWEEALFNGHRIESEGIIVAAPYFISPKNLQHPVLVWNWFINNTAISAPTFKKNFLPLKAQPGVSGVSRVGLELNSRDKIFQSANHAINIEF